jgi:hypothetical protein
MKRIACLMLLPMLAAAAAAAGCGSGKSYEVEVKNQTLRPVTLWLTKDGPPKEEGWFSPEDLGAIPANARPGYDLAIVPPARTGFTGKLSGEFPRGTNAVLRVYEGEKELFHILEDAKAGRANRVDQVLQPGMNRLSVVDRGGQMVVERSK